MNSRKQKLELTWIGKDKEPRLEPRVLIEDSDKSYGNCKGSSRTAPTNMLIHGDNLLALKALEQDFAGKIKCIYIDPPFNTGNAFEHYDDGIEHSIWLNLMKNRLEHMKNLLDPAGLLMIHLDDTELAYAKVLLDEIFGRNNYLNMISLTTNDPSGFKATSMSLFSTANYILIYAKDKACVILNKIYIRKKYDSAYSKVLEDRDIHFSEYKWRNIKDVVAEEMGYRNYKDAKKQLKEKFDTEVVELIFLKKMEQYAIKNAKRVFRTAAIGGGAKIKRQQTRDLSKGKKDVVMQHPN